MITRKRDSRIDMVELKDSLDNFRSIKEVLYAISKGQKVTPEEKMRAVRYEQNKRTKRK